MRRTSALLLLVLVACTARGAVGSALAPRAWPPARWVGDLRRFDGPSTYETGGSASDDGRWVAIDAYRNDGRGHVYLVDTRRDHVTRVDHGYGGGPPSAGGSTRADRYDGSGGSQITPDGRFVVFGSVFTNLVPHDANRGEDIFVYDRVRRTTVLVSHANDGRSADGASSDPAISANGRYVAFASRATNLSRNDDDDASDVYLADLRRGTIELVSIGSAGKGDADSGAPDVSDDGTRVAFSSSATNLVDGDTNHAIDVFVRDLSTGRTTRVSVSSSGAELDPLNLCESATCDLTGALVPRISGNGRVVVFTTQANGLVPDDRNFNPDVYAHDLDDGTTERVSVRSDGGDAYRPEDADCGRNAECVGAISTGSPSISRDGSLVYFVSAAPRISDEDEDRSGGFEAYVRDRTRGQTLLVSRYADGSVLRTSNFYAGAISANGSWITYGCDSMKLDGPLGDRDGNPDVYLQGLPAPAG